ncbi:AsnC family transcriptional regulator [Dialister hominis]|uniref:AsnC family transcriptional regulator n=1 Tax=Dialister hominis TaxID=2582419 RepID=UPI0040275CFB
MQNSVNKNIDDIDRQILEILMRNARISMTELGKRVHMTSQAIKNRLERLNELGVVQRYTVNVNCPVYGLKTHAIIKLNLNSQKQLQLLDYIQSNSYHIIHFYQITGAMAYMIDSYFLDDEELQTFLKHIQQYGAYEIQLVLQDIPLDDYESV